MNYEYIQLEFEWGDLEELNRLSISGFRVVHVGQIQASGDPRIRHFKQIALLEREVPAEVAARTIMEMAKGERRDG